MCTYRIVLFISQTCVYRATVTETSSQFFSKQCLLGNPKLSTLQMLNGYFCSSVPVKVTFQLNMALTSFQSFSRTLADIGMLFQTNSSCSGSPSTFSEMLEKMETGEGLVFPTATAVEWSGSAVIGGGAGGGERGVGRLFKGWLFTLLVSWGLRSSVQQNGPSN